MDLLIRGGTVVTATESWRGDVRCRRGQVAELGADLEPAGEEVVDAAGQYVFPGGVDPHVHLSLPVAGTVSADDFASGTAAALAGGTTTVVDFVHPERGEDLLAALAARKDEATASLADWSLHMAITGWGEETGEQMRRCVEEEGIRSFKTYMAYRETVGIDDEALGLVMARAAELGALVVVHAEDGAAIERLRDSFAAIAPAAPASHAASRPPATEGEATARAALLAAAARADLYVFHVTCRQAVEAIAAARARGQRVWGETCPHYLLLDDGVYAQPGLAGAAYVVSPPLRPAEHQGALWAALAAGTLAIVSTDHCPFTAAQKRAGLADFRRIPGGAPGIEHRLSLLWTHGVRQGRIDMHRFVDLVATAPARLLGLHPRKGSLAPGADADVVLWDPTATATLSAATHHHRTDLSIYEGFAVVGRPAVVISRGEIVYRDGELRVAPGRGRFLPRFHRPEPTAADGYFAPPARAICSSTSPKSRISSP